MKKIITLISCFCLVIILASCVLVDDMSTFKAGTYSGTMTVDGRVRNYIIHIPPAYDGKKSLPIVIVLHGGGGNADKMPGLTGFNEKADAAGFIVVYPNGTGPVSDEKLLTWNCGFCCGYAMDNNVDDVNFIRQLIDRAEKNLKVDPARIFVTGISNGGMMTYRLGCELADKIAAIAPVAGSMGDWTVKSDSPVSVVIFHGTADQHVLYNGGAPIIKFDTHDRIDKPVSYAVDFWVQHNGCSTEIKRGVSGNITRDTYSGGRGGSEVVLYTIFGGKHAWPGGNAAWAGGDTATQEISATDLMWEFFKAHPKK
jgi:polyhydroxybutyrate depolymerase